MRAHAVVAMLLAAAAAACTRPDENKSAAVVHRPNWLAGVPYITQSRLLDTTGTPDAQHVVILSPAPLDSVARFYRTRLRALGWEVVSDVHDTSHVSLYLVRGGLPMWIRIDALGKDSRVSFTAAGGSGPKAAAPADTGKQAAAPAAPPR